MVLTSWICVSVSYAQVDVDQKIIKEVNTYILDGDKHLVNENIDSAAFYFLKAEALARKENYIKGIADFVSYYIFVLNRQGRYDEALTLTLESVEISKKLKNDRLLTTAYNNVGAEYNYLGDFNSAAIYYLKALHIAEKAKDYDMQQLLSNNISSIFLKLKNKEKGLFYAKKSYELAVQNSDTFGIASSLINLANSERLYKRYAQSASYSRRVIKLSQELNDPSYALDGYLELADVAIDSKALEDALVQYQNALEVLKSYPSSDYESRIYWGLANAYFLLNEYEAASDFIKKGIAISTQAQAKQELRQQFLLGSEIMEKLQLPYVALDFRKKYEILNDSLLSAENHRNIHKLEIEYQTSQKEKEIAEQQLLIANSNLEIQKKNTFIYLSAVIVLGLLLLLVIFYLIYRNKQKANAEKLAALKREGEMKVLMALMEGEEKERSRLARELHDGVGGILSATKMHLSILKSEEAVPERFQKFDHTVSMLDSATHEIRTIAHN
ncbi:tetratricopeptide repeat protein, partial [Cesiribacter sp. SM1]|uniref:ATP-binding protein n=1 Tax=Cesiribacter sp. SM1 TaxID=2861196 RepID=UPI001CD28A6A